MNIMPLSKQLMKWLIAISKGGLTRARIILLLRQNPMNVQQLSEKMEMHYTTIQHHVEMLAKHGFLVSSGEKYGKAFFLSQDLEDEWNEFEKIVQRIK